MRRTFSYVGMTKAEAHYSRRDFFIRPSNLYVGADLNNPVRRKIKIISRINGITGHKGKKCLSPVAHFGFAGGKNRFPAQVKSGTGKMDFRTQIP